MPIRSMTGYGQGSAETPAIRITVELRAVNNRYVDLRLRMPPELASWEGDLRRRIQQRVRRGRVEMSLGLEGRSGAEAERSLNRPLVEALIEAAGTLRAEYGLEGSLEPAALLALPGVMRPVPEVEQMGDEGRQAVEKALDAALDALDRERLREGEALADDLTDRVNRMLDLVTELKTRAGRAPAQARKRFQERIEALSAGVAELDEARVAQEAAFLADRTDVTEELVRLEGHLAQARALIGESDEQPVGKRLDFLLQEVHRETNTVNAKSQDLQLSRVALALKAEAEKVREQVQNLE